MRGRISPTHVHSKGLLSIDLPWTGPNTPPVCGCVPSLRGSLASLPLCWLQKWHYVMQLKVCQNHIPWRSWKTHQRPFHLSPLPGCLEESTNATDNLPCLVEVILAGFHDHCRRPLLLPLERWLPQLWPSKTREEDCPPGGAQLLAWAVDNLHLVPRPQGQLSAPGTQQHWCEGAHGWRSSWRPPSGLAHWRSLRKFHLEGMGAFPGLDLPRLKLQQRPNLEQTNSEGVPLAESSRSVLTPCGIGKASRCCSGLFSDVAGAKDAANRATGYLSLHGSFPGGIIELPKFRKKKRFIPEETHPIPTRVGPNTHYFCKVL